MTFSQGVSGGVGLICLVAAALIWTVGGRHTPRLVVILTIVGAMGLTGSIGHWIRTAIDWLNSAVGSVAGWLTGAVVVGIVGFACAYVVVIHVKNRNIDEKTLACSFALPFTAASLPGVLGSIVVTVLAALGSGMAWVIGHLFGIG